MSKKTKISKPVESTITRETAAPAKKEPTTLTEFYSAHYQIQLHKREKEAREQLLLNLSKPNRIVRGEPVEYEDVRVFVRDVINSGEEAFDKFVAKQKAAAEALVKKEQKA